MTDLILKFTRVLKNGAVFYFFEGFENVKYRWELPCEYLSFPHFAAWDRTLLYSDGHNLFLLDPGNEISEVDYSKFIDLIEKGKERLKEINGR